jgi:hypothetical protein
MTRCLSAVLLAAALAAGCAQLPPTPQDIQAKKFETLPDKAVIYVVRNSPDMGPWHGTLWLGDNITITTFPGTYFRWEVPPGTHRITGVGYDTSQIDIRAEAGKLYFVQHAVAGFRSPTSGFLSRLTEREGRAMVLRGELIASF